MTYDSRSTIHVPRFAFFGTPERAVWALETMKSAGFIPKLIVTQPNKPKGRNLTLESTPVKMWAEKEKIKCLQPEVLDESFAKVLKEEKIDVSIVIAYGKIIPLEVLNAPKYGSLNIHGSLLPKLRGPSPIETAILNDSKENGVTIILMDELIDHGPIIATKNIKIDPWPIQAEKLAEIIVKDGTSLLCEILPKWIKGEIKAVGQNHTEATFTKKIKKEDALIDLSGNPYQNLLKINAYSLWPKAYFIDDFNGQKKRMTITLASVEDGKLILKKIIPEGKKEMLWEDYLRGKK